jgi:FkbM family methyltransferase
MQTDKFTALEKLVKDCPVIADDHRLIAETFLREFCQHFRPRGVIHVGAHNGQEVDLYRQYGFKNILLIEANPQLAHALQTRYGDAQDVRVVLGAATNEDGDQLLKIHTSRSGSIEAASLLELKDFKTIVATLHTPAEVSVPGFRIDSLFGAGKLDIALYNFMVLDIQGAELRALQGAPLTAQALDAIQAEAGIIEMYAGGASYADLEIHFHGSNKTLRKGVLHELYNASGRFPAWGEFYFSQTIYE